MAIFSFTSLRDIFKHADLLYYGACEREGHYIPIDDAIKGDFETNKKYFDIDDDFPDGKEWVIVSCRG